MRKTFVFVSLFISTILISNSIHPDDKKMLLLPLEDVIFRARSNDLELKNRSFTLVELKKSKKNIYRSLFPKISTTFGSSDSISEGEEDSRNYNFNVTLHQVVYDQLSSPLLFKNYDISLEESRLEIKEREKDIERQSVNLYLAILLSVEKLKNKREEHLLYERLFELAHEEHRMGMKTLLDLIEIELRLNRVQLDEEELNAQQEIYKKDLFNLIRLDSCKYQIILSDDVDEILSNLLGLDVRISFKELYEYLLSSMDIFKNVDELYHTAVRNDFNVKKMRLSLQKNRVSQKLLAIQFLDNIYLSYGIDFTGEKFFPANTTHTLAVNVLLDFGIVSSDVAVSRSSAENKITESRGAESEVLNTLYPISEGKYLKLESYQTLRKLEDAENEIMKNLQVWNIKMQNLLKTQIVKLKQKDSMSKNEELFKLKLQMGEIKETDYMEFLIKKNDFHLELEEIKYDFIHLIWEFEDLLNIKFEDFINSY